MKITAESINAIKTARQATGISYAHALRSVGLANAEGSFHSWLKGNPCKALAAQFADAVFSFYGVNVEYQKKEIK